MDIIYERCCGLDIHKRSVVACLIVPGPAGTPHKEIRTFGTMTDDLLALADWLGEHAVTHVAMESTGVYWQPIYNLLEGSFALVLVNARHIKAVPGRKTDVRDCEWLADLLRHGLLRASFVPDRPQRELRELTRYRTSLIRERAAEVNRLQKTLEGANIKLASVATDIMGASGRAMLAALLAGTTDARTLAELAKGRLREKLPELERALTGQMAAHQRFLLAQQLAHIDFLEATIDRVGAEIGERLRPFEEAISRLDTIPGVGRRVAEVLLTEIGTDMTRFPSAAHLASWAGMCPGNNESAGKRKSGRTRKGSPWLRAALVEAAQAAGRTRQTYLGAQYRRLAARRGTKRAVVAVGHSILVIAYHLLRRDTRYDDLGPHYFDERDRQAVQRRLVRRLGQLGLKVSLEPAA
ncbi:MAG TPA: IS110 family transposase [Pseudonocardiaceae bacterium]|nr:IS110 family transposase [Pseudonocardiaceae bacterium]